MITVTEIKHRVSELVESNRGLSHDLASARRDLAGKRRTVEQLLREREELLRVAQAERARACGAQDKLDRLAHQLEATEQERDEIMAQFAMASDSMHDLRECLAERYEGF